MIIIDELKNMEPPAPFLSSTTVTRLAGQFLHDYERHNDMTLLPIAVPADLNKSVSQRGSKFKCRTTPHNGPGVDRGIGIGDNGTRSSVSHDLTMVLQQFAKDSDKGSDGGSDGSSDDERKQAPSDMRLSITQFMTTTGCPDEYNAKQWLEIAGHDLREAVSFYNESKQQCEQEESKSSYSVLYAITFPNSINLTRNCSPIHLIEESRTNNGEGVDEIIDLSQMSFSKDSVGSSDDDDDERKPPPRDMRIISQFMVTTGCPDEYNAERFLDSAGHDLREAVSFYNESKQQCEQEESKSSYSVLYAITFPDSINLTRNCSPIHLI
jgi:phage terminase Nu1 subunit (DNA packaging protein)